MSKNTIKILGAYGGKAANMQLTSLQLSKHIVLDAGNILGGLGNGIKHINHIFVTHSHLDHINDIPFLIDSTFTDRTIPLKIYGRKKTLENLHKYILNGNIWPDFTEINLINSDLKAIELIEIKINETIKINDYKIKAIKNNHTDSSNGYVIEKNDRAVLFTSDTYCCDEIWQETNSNKKIKVIISDVSFPSRMSKLAFDSKHLTPQLLKNELKKLNRRDVTIYANHIKPTYKTEVFSEIIKFDILLNGGTILEAQDIIEF